MDEDREPGPSYPDPPPGTLFERTAAQFEALRSLPAEPRRQALRHLAGTDSEVHREVVRLLARHEEDSSVLADPEHALEPDLIAGALDGGAGQPLPCFGRYRATRELGRGGMGVVHLAERTGDDFEQRVAVKVLRPGVVDEELLRRFRTERRILAGLRHPNIAALVDGGTTDDGEPYVVMEFVEGTDLMRHVAEHRLDLRERLELFCKVCAAVDHAHRRLVVHRDLKPGNVLVTAAGEPKLLDFGIAKLLDPDPSDPGTLAVTGAGALLLTPEYASPEQVRGEPISTATDVYALGAILYELLCGARAQPLETRSVTELERVVIAETPRPPSRAVTEGHPLAEPPARLARLLAGDLDTIVHCALRKEPERRYGSAAALAEDIRRHLRGLPVTARKDTWRYRTGKFLHRHPWAVAAWLLAFSLLAGAAIGLAFQAGRLEDQARQLVRERDLARRGQSVAREVSDFLVGLYLVAEPDEERADLVKARNLLDRGSRQIADELGSDPLMRAGQMEAMGRAYLALGLYDDAERLLVGALALREGAPEEQAAHAASRHWLGELRMHQGRYEESVDLLRTALESRRELDPGGITTAGTLTLLAEGFREMGRTAPALAAIEEATAILRGNHGGAHPSVADCLQVHGQILQERGDLDGAETLLDECAEMRRRLFGPRHPVHAESQRRLGELYKLQGRYGPAVAAFEQALELDREILGDDHPNVDSDLFGLALSADRQGDYGRAEDLLREILERDRRRFGEHHPYVALDLSQIAGLVGRRGDVAAAEELFRRALAMQRELLPDDHPEIATTLSNFGVMYRRNGRWQDAVPLFEEALARRERLLPPGHHALLTSRNLMALVHYERDELEEAERLYRAVAESRRRTLGEHPHTAGSLYSVAATLHAAGRPEEALSMVEESLAMYRTTLPSDHPELARPQALAGRLHLAAGRFERAEPLLRAALAIRRAHLRPGSSGIASLERDLERCRQHR